MGSGSVRNGARIALCGQRTRRAEAAQQDQLACSLNVQTFVSSGGIDGTAIDRHERGNAANLSRRRGDVVNILQSSG